MKKNTFWFTAAVVLSMTFAACNNDAIEVDPEPTPEDSLNNENTPGQYPIEFTTSVIDNSPFVEITDQNIESMYLVGTGTQPFKNIERWDGFYCYHVNYSTYVLGNPEPYHFNRSDMPFFYKYKRNKDDRDVWESAEKYLNRYYTWDRDVWQYASVNNPNNTRYHAYYNNSPFFEVSSHGHYNMEGFNIDLQWRIPDDEQNGTAEEYFVHSKNLRDLVIGFSDVQMYNGTASDRKTDKVKITFTHPLARLELAALVEDDEAIDVTVGYAAIGGLHTRAVYHPTSIYSKYSSDWEMQMNYKDYYAWLEMTMDGPVHLATTAKPLQKKGAEPWVFPESLKGWTNAAIGDGCGLMLGVWIKNKYDGSYIVGSEDGYDLVYMPLDPITLESENNYVFEVTFGCQYDVNGNPSGYHISYQPQIQEWNKTEKEVNMVKK